MRKNCFLIFLLAASMLFQVTNAQLPITSITTSGNTAPLVTYTNYKAAGLRLSTGLLRSSWDSTGTSFTVKYNTAASNNIKSVTQYTVTGIAGTVLTAPANAVVKLRRVGNTYVNDTRVHHNFWATYSSVPAALATSGTFNFTAPEVLLPEHAFLLNNITSGYDNIFENTIANLHASNIERLDFIIPDGLAAYYADDLDQSGVAIFDRGTGDPFKIAAITSINASNDPTAYGPLVSVTAANFGANLLPSSFDYCIITRDTKFRSQSRPSSPDNQNLKGVYISLRQLGLTVNQQFYGYSVFGPDVTSANPNWTTYPTGTSTSSGLDPVNIMGLYKTPMSVLSVPMGLSAVRNGTTARLNFNVNNIISNDKVIVEHSTDGAIFSELAIIRINSTGDYTYTHHQPVEGNNFYRLKLIEKSGVAGFTEIRRVLMPGKPVVSVYPNPASAHMNIKLPANWQQKNIKIELIDITGRISLRYNPTQNRDIHSVDLKNVMAGWYTVRVMNLTDDLVFNTQILIVRNN